MSWVKVKDMIEDEIDRIFWDEPEEITMCTSSSQIDTTG